MTKEKSNYNVAGDLIIASHFNFMRGNIKEAAALFETAMEHPSMKILASAIENMNEVAYTESASETFEEDASDDEDDFTSVSKKEKEDDDSDEDEDEDLDEDEDEDYDDEHDDDDDDEEASVLAHKLTLDTGDGHPLDESDWEDTEGQLPKKPKKMSKASTKISVAKVAFDSREARALANKISMYGDEETVEQAKKIVVQK